MTRFEPKRRLRALALLAAFAAAGGCWALWLGQDVNWDQRNYHFYNPYALLADRLTFDVAPAQMQTFLPQLYNVPFHLLATSAPPRLLGFLLGAAHGVVLLLVLAIARHALRGPGAWWMAVGATAFGAWAPAIHSELGTTFGDDTTAAFLLLALLPALRSRGRASAAVMALAGVAAGVSVGLKYTNAVYALALLAGLAVLWLRGGAPRRAVPAMAAGLVVGLLAVAGPWMWRLQEVFGSPVFPLFNQVFRSPDYPPVAFRDVRWLPKDAWDALRLPFTLATFGSRTMEVPCRDPRWAVLAVLGVIAAMRTVGRRDHRPVAGWLRPAARALLLTLGATAFVLWVVGFTVHRYLVPLEALSGLLLIALLDLVTGSRRGTVVAAVVVGAAVLPLVRIPTWGRLAWADSWYGVETGPVAPDTLVVMLGGDPTAYVVPFFPPGVRFVRLQGNLAHVTRGTRFAARVAGAIATHRGPVEALAAGPVPPDADAALAEHGLRLERERCRPVATRIRDGLVRCPLDRVAHPDLARQAAAPPDPAQASARAPSSAVRVGDPAAAAQLVDGFYALESSWRWTKPRFRIVLGVPPGADASGGRLRLRFFVAAAAMQVHPRLALRVTVGSVTATRTYDRPEEHLLELELPATLLQEPTITADFTVDPAFRPGGGDERVLGVVAMSAELVPR